MKETEDAERPISSAWTGLMDEVKYLRCRYPAPSTFHRTIELGGILVIGGRESRKPNSVICLRAHGRIVRLAERVTFPTSCGAVWTAYEK